MGLRYAAREDVFKVGLPRSALSKPPIIVTANPVSDQILLGSHLFAADAAVQFAFESGGALPAPLAVGTTYYVKLAALAGGGTSDEAFQLAAAPAGAAIDLTTSGTAPFMVYESLGPSLDDALETYSRWIDQRLIAHGAPFVVPVPVQIRTYVAVRAAGHMIRVLGKSEQLRGVLELEANIITDVDRMSKGELLRDPTATASTNRAVSGSSSSTKRSEETLP